MELAYLPGKPEMLWQSGVQNVYLLFGEEDRLKTEALVALKAHLVDADFSDFDYEVLNAQGADAASILSACGQIPFGSERRLVVVKGMEQWRDRNKQSEAERLAAGIAKLGSSCCLVLIASAEEEEERRKTGITVKLDNAVKKSGAVVTCRALQGENLYRWVDLKVKNEGKLIARDATELLVETAGNEMRVLEMEISKLASFIGDREIITNQDVAKVVASTPDDVLFTMIDAVTRKQTDQALLRLAELHRYDPKPQAVAAKLIALLSRQYRMLWQAKYLAQEKVNPKTVRNLPPELSAELPTESNIIQMHFKAYELFSIARNYTWNELLMAMELLLLCDLANKGGVTDELGIFGSEPTTNLQLLILELTQ